VKEQIELLKTLQQIDSAILSLRMQIESVPVKISSQERIAQNALNAKEEAAQSLSSITQKKKEKESELQSINDIVNKLKNREASIKNDKEFKANQKEVEKSEKDRKTVEHGLKEIVNSLEGASKVVDIESSRAKEEESKLEIVRQQLTAEAAKNEEEIKKLKAERKKLIHAIQEDIYSHYISIMKSCGGLAVVEAKNEICQGCNIHIPPQLFVEIKKFEDIINCPQCRRILYYSKEMVEPEKSI
jgi:predicted  nucleic acid-binding Zn-ribbon protein